MSLEEWKSLSPDEFNHVLEAFYNREERKSKESWLQTRKLAMFVMAGYTNDVDEKKYFPLPFDEKDVSEKPDEKPTRERFEQLIKKYGDEKA